MIIIGTIESALIRKVYQLWFQKRWSQIWMVQVQTVPAISYDDADAQVNQITVTFAESASTMY